MTDTQATPRPWRDKPSVWPRAYDLGVYDDDGGIIANIGAYRSGEEAEANRALIVKAVNAYDAMREALEQIAKDDYEHPHGIAECACERTAEIARAALAAAEGKGE